MSRVTPSPSVIEAIKKAAIAKAKAAGKEGAVSPDMEVEKVKAKPEPAVVWPTIMSMEGPAFSKIFPEAWAGVKGDKSRPDFNIPDYSSHPHPEWMKAYVPKSSDYKADPKLVYDAALAFVCGSVTHLVGWPGTGKSNGLPVLLASRLGLPLLRLGLNKKGMMFDDLIGREAIKQTDEGMVTGHKDGVLVPWTQQPCIILADEFSRANAEISNGLMSFMERGGSLIVENREVPVIQRHKHCWIIASDNVKGLGDGVGKFVGTDMVDNAILDRFEVTLEVDYLTRDQHVSLLQEWYPGFPKKEAESLAAFAELIQQGYKKDSLPLSFSPRALKEVGRYACLHQDMAIAVRKVVLAKYAEESDIGAVKEMYRTAFGKSL
jgi:cobaltochelatase CobS